MPEKILYLADTLSRAYLPTTEPIIEDDVVMIHCFQLEESAKRILHKVYLQDETMSTLSWLLCKAGIGQLGSRCMC